MAPRARIRHAALVPDYTGTGTPVNSKPISLSHYPDAWHDSEVSSDYDYPSPIPRGDMAMSKSGSGSTQTCQIRQRQLQ